MRRCSVALSRTRRAAAAGPPRRARASPPGRARRSSGRRARTRCPRAPRSRSGAARERDLHEVDPDRERRAPAGLALAEHLLRVEADPDAGDDVGREADEPGVGLGVRWCRSCRRPGGRARAPWRPCPADAGSSARSRSTRQVGLGSAASRCIGPIGAAAARGACVAARPVAGGCARSAVERERLEHALPSRSSTRRMKRAFGAAPAARERRVGARQLEQRDRIGAEREREVRLEQRADAERARERRSRGRRRRRRRGGSSRC